MTAGKATAEEAWWAIVTTQSQVLTLPRWSVGVDGLALVFQIFIQVSDRMGEESGALFVPLLRALQSVPPPPLPCAAQSWALSILEDTRRSGKAY